jgi:hypothetical protein
VGGSDIAFWYHCTTESVINARVAGPAAGSGSAFTG